ncbi:SIR2 family protein [Aeromonas veronii]|uniref:SIR2 family protein n=1 Tax=Aeromonas TaxID=642 RepID=UPI0030057425
MINWPKDVISSIARRRAVIFIGAGVSMGSIGENGQKPPSWTQFLEKGIESINRQDAKEAKDFLKKGDYLSCCQILKDKLGHGWANYLEESFLVPAYQPNELHKAIFSLDASIVMTPNVDKIYDQFIYSQIGHAQGNPNVAVPNNIKIKRFFDEDIPRVLRGNEKQRLLLKIHGCIDTPDKLIFTREDYAGIRNKHANFYKAIDSLIFTHTFLFIGCGMNDPDLSLVLENYSMAFEAAPPHYVVLSEKLKSNHEALLSKNYNLKVIKYSPNNDHQELLDSIKDLAEKVDAYRGDLSTSTLW